MRYKCAFVNLFKRLKPKVKHIVITYNFLLSSFILYYGIKVHYQWTISYNFSPCVCGEGAWQPFMHNLFNYLTVSLPTKKSLPTCNRIFLSLLIHTLDFLRIAFNAYIGLHRTMDSRLWVKSFNSGKLKRADRQAS